MIARPTPAPAGVAARPSAVTFPRSPPRILVNNHASTPERASSTDAVDERAGDIETADVIKQRIGTLLAMRRVRRQRVQLPLIAASGLALAVCAGIVAADWSRRLSVTISLRYTTIALLYAVIALITVAVMPGDVWFVRALLIGVALISATTSALGARSPLLLARLLVSSWAAQGAAARTVNVTTTMSTLLVMLVFAPALALASLWLLLASWAGYVSPLRLPSLVLRLISWAFVALGGCYMLVLPAFALIGDAQHRFFPETRAQRSELLIATVVVCVQTLATGLTGLLKRDLRAHLHGFLAMRGVGVSAAAGIAELLNGVKAADVLRSASETFRAVSLDDLTFEHFAVQHARAAEPSAVASAPTTAERALGAPWPDPAADRPGSPRRDIAKKAKLGHVDAFLSHSWHDPPAAKWKALQEWGREFRAAHGRAPLLWFDRVCIDQANVEGQLASLPVYLAGCQTLLVLHGPSYLCRLWCIVELFTFFQAHLPAPPDDRIHFRTLNTDWSRALPPGRRHTRARASPAAPEPLPLIEPTQESTRDERTAEQVARAHAAGLADAEAFDVRAATATLPSDKERLLAVIEGSGDVGEHFSQWIRTLVVTKIKEAQNVRLVRTESYSLLRRSARSN